MKIELGKDEKELIDFFKTVISNPEKSKMIAANFFVKKGIEKVSQEVKKLPKPVKELLHTILENSK